ALRGIIRYWNAWGSRFHPAVVLVMAQPAFYVQESPPQFPRAGNEPLHTPSAWWSPRLIEKVREVIHYPAFLQLQRVQNVLDAEIRGRDSSWFYWAPPKDRLEMYGHDLDSLVVAIRAAGSEPILVACPNRLGSVVAVDDSAQMTEW